jgi:hypothetical protein
VIFEDGSIRIGVVCIERRVAVQVSVVGSSEQYKVYRQVVSGIRESAPISETVSNESVYYLWGISPEDITINNFPEGGAIHIEDVASGKEWYFGVDGSSFIGKASASGSITTCEYSGVINIGTN